MKIIYIAVLLVTVLIVAGVLIKLRLNRRLEDIDGLGRVFKSGGEDDDVIAVLGDDKTEK